MSFTANKPDGRSVAATDDDAAWDAIVAAHRDGTAPLACPECADQLIPRSPRGVKRHFYHRGGEATECGHRGAGESNDHLWIKAHIVDAAIKAGYAATDEWHCGSFTADVAIFDGDRPVLIVEVQLSDQSYARTVERDAERTAIAPTLWIAKRAHDGRFPWVEIANNRFTFACRHTRATATLIGLLRGMIDGSIKPLPWDDGYRPPPTYPAEPKYVPCPRVPAASPELDAQRARLAQRDAEYDTRQLELRAQRDAEYAQRRAEERVRLEAEAEAERAERATEAERRKHRVTVRVDPTEHQARLRAEGDARLARKIAGDPWKAGIARAEGDLTAYRAELARQGTGVPVSRTAAACSILASPHIATWPVACREWLWGKATRWPRGMEEPHHAISRSDLNLP